MKRYLAAAAGAAALTLLTGCGGLDPVADKFGAEVMCESFVKDKLKSPGTAKFPRSTVTTTGTAPDWTVKGSVDSQNSFGAMIRSDYTCKVKALDERGDKWRAMSVKVS